VSTGCCRRFVGATIYRILSNRHPGRPGPASIKLIQSSASRMRLTFAGCTGFVSVGGRSVGCRRHWRSQFVASEDEKRVDARPFHLTRGPLSVRCAASAAVARGGRPLTRDRAWIRCRARSVGRILLRPGRAAPSGNAAGLDRADRRRRGDQSAKDRTLELTPVAEPRLLIQPRNNCTAPL